LETHFKFQPCRMLN